MDIGEFEGWALGVTPHLFRYARHLERDWHSAEDLVQDTLAKLYVNWWRVDETLNLKAYALQTMFHHFVSRRRRRSSGAGWPPTSTTASPSAWSPCPTGSTPPAVRWVRPRPPWPSS